LTEARRGMVNASENKIVLPTLIRESFKQEALASRTAHQETGKHLAGQEVRTWLNTWGTEAEAELAHDDGGVCHP